MDIGTVGMWFVLDAMTAPESIEFAQKIEKLGYNTLWIPEGFGREPFAHAAQLLAHTKRLIIATGIAVSHKPIVDDLRGHNYKPYSYMKEYLPKMKSALYMAPKPKEPVPVVVAALHPKMLELAATHANGTHPYFVPPEHTARVRAAIGPKPMICVE